MKATLTHNVTVGWSVILVIVIVLSGIGCSTRKATQADGNLNQIASGQPPALIELSDTKLQDALKEGDIPEESRDDLPWLPKRPPTGTTFEATQDLQTIYFEFDKYSLTAQSTEILNKNAEWLKQHPDVLVQIEGHCDDRGTTDYNQVLGENRAMGTKKYLISLGVSPDQLYTISYGESKPVDPGQTEEAWAKNRRCEFKIGR